MITNVRSDRLQPVPARKTPQTLGRLKPVTTNLALDRLKPVTTNLALDRLKPVTTNLALDRLKPVTTNLAFDRLKPVTTNLGKAMQQRMRVSERASAQRRGAALIAAMIAVLLASVVGTILVKTALAQRRMAIREGNRQQSIWLAESALDRAAAKLSRDPKYTGETWNLPAAELGGREPGRVEIKVAANPSAANLRTVTVTALYPVESTHRSRTTKTVIIDLNRFQNTKPASKKEKQKP